MSTREVEMLEFTLVSLTSIGGDLVVEVVKEL